MRSLLDTILSMLRTIQDDEVKFQKLHDFMINEISEEPDDKVGIRRSIAR